MPRNVRNFWVDGRIDGRQEPLSGGPQRADGGFYLTIRQRSKGDIIIAAQIDGRVLSDGTLVLNIMSDGNTPIVVKTSR